MEGIQAAYGLLPPRQGATAIAWTPRKRGGQPKKLGTLPSGYDIVLIMRDRHKVTTDHILPNFEGATY